MSPSGRGALAASVAAAALVGAGVAVSFSRWQIGTMAFALVAAAAFAVTLSTGAAAAVGFAFVGVFKTSEAFGDPNSPIPTAALVVALAVAALRTRGGDRPAVAWAVALLPATIVLTISAFFVAGGTDAAVTKLGRVIALALVPSVLGAAIFVRPRQQRGFLVAAAIVGGLCSAIIVGRGLTDGLSAVGVTLFNENRIVLGRALGVGCIASLAAVMLPVARWARASFIVLTALSALATFFSGSRGAVLGLAVGAAVLFALSLRSGRQRWILPVLALGVGVILMVTVPDSDLADRYLSILTPSADVTTVQRRLLATAAITEFVASPLVGSGLGSFVYAFTPSAPPATYAHNIVLELLSETGLFGTFAVLVPIVAVTWLAGRRLLRHPDPELAGFFALFASAAAAAQFSGDLQINRHLFFFSGALWAMAVPFTSRVSVPRPSAPAIGLTAGRSV